MKEYFISLQNEIGFYYNLIKYFLYFCIGALFLFLLNYCLKIFNFLFSKFSKEKLISHLNLTLRFLIFAIVSKTKPYGTFLSPLTYILRFLFPEEMALSLGNN